MTAAANNTKAHHPRSAVDVGAASTSRLDLFGNAAPVPTLVQLDRTTDRERPCCKNLAILHAARGPHAAELRCAQCNRPRDWMPKQALDFLKETAARFGATSAPIVLRDSTIGEKTMSDFDNTNRGALFRNDQKDKDSDRDYSGTLNVGGTEYWLSGWMKTSKKGTKFLSLSVKPKEPAANGKKKPVGAEFDDAIPF
jgi:hypothetical protein